jgi:hypothetical protein
MNGFAFGIDYADELPADSDAALNAGLSDAQTAGAGWIRVDLAWYRIEPEKGTWNWSSFDRTAAFARQKGLRILAILDQAPAWARESSCATKLWCPPADDAEFAEFATQAVRRYPSDVVSGWEVWNEQNLAAYWAGGPDPAGYTALLKAASTAIRATQPQAEIILGGLALAGTDGVTISPEDYLTDVAERGALKYVSAVGYHPYTFPTLPSKAAAFTAIGTGPHSLAAVLDRYDAPSMPIWLTEAGAAVTGAATDPRSSGTGAQIEEQEQAGYVTDLVRTATGNPHVKALFWFSDIDLPAQHLYFGLRRADGTDRPALHALAQAISAYRARG